MRTLESLLENEYEYLRERGLLYEFYPEATGNWYDDTIWAVVDTLKPKALTQVDVVNYAIPNLNGNMKVPPKSKRVEDANVNRVVQKIQDRADAGMLKYGVTTSDNPLSLEEWLQHAQEELTDAAVYIERIMEELRK